MFHRLHELARCLPQRAAWERLNEGLPDLYDRGLALCFAADGAWVEFVLLVAFLVVATCNPLQQGLKPVRQDQIGLPGHSRYP